MTPGNRLLDAALELQAFCVQRQWQFCFIGGIAVQHWGEARLTRDADVELYTGIGDEAEYIDAVLGTFPARSADAREFALAHRVLLVEASNGIPLDVSLGALEFEERAVASASDIEIVAGVRLRVVAPTALLVFKVFAGRPQDWIDVEGIIVRSGRLIDWAEVRTDLSLLLELKGDLETLDRLERLRTQLT